MAKIGITDSGVGALTLVPYMMETGHRTTCLIDDKNAPYGNKTHGELVGICARNVGHLFDMGMDGVVIMCNTLSTVCREVWKDKSKVIAVEPALGLIGAGQGKRRALICTPATAQKEDILLNARARCVDVIPLSSLAGIIDALILDEQRLKEYLQKSLGFIHNYDEVVLGCTHYSLIKPMFKEVFPSVEFLDGTAGVFARIKQVFGTNSGENPELNLRTTSGSGVYKLTSVVKKLKKF